MGNWVMPENFVKIGKGIKERFIFMLDIFS